MNLRNLMGAVSLAAVIGGTVTGPARSQTIYLGLQEAGVNGGVITQIGAGEAATDGFNAALKYGVFNFLSASGYGAANSSSGYGTTVSAAVNKGQSSPSVLDVYLTETDLTGNIVPVYFASGLTANGLSAGWTVTETVYVDPGNGKFTTVDAIGTKNFLAASAVATNFTAAVSGLSTYSITEFYQITSPGGAFSAGSVLATETVSSTVPEISTWAMLCAGFAALGLVSFGRNKKARIVEA